MTTSNEAGGYNERYGRNIVDCVPISKIERYQESLVELITKRTPISVSEANGIREALSELKNYKRLASIKEVCEMLDNL